jgi:hypothetical protein
MGVAEARSRNPFPWADYHAADSAPKQVNELIALARRESQVPHRSIAPPIATPSVPPAIRHILQLPEVPPPLPRNPRQRTYRSLRGPAGPPAPRSWVARLDSSRQQAQRHLGVPNYHATPGIPGAYEPQHGSLVDIVLRSIAADWEFQKTYNEEYWHLIPTHLKSGLIRHISILHDGGISASDLRLILHPQRDAIDSAISQPVVGFEPEDALSYLDLSSSIGSSISVREVSEVLFSLQKGNEQSDIQDTWDIAESLSMTNSLFVNITHLSLATTPQAVPYVSWRQLLSLTSKLSTITHLSLAYWPEPSFTGNAKFASVVSPLGTTVQYGGTGPYSHSLDNDWSEALIVLRKLSRNLYGLEYLDLTGCGAWFPALIEQVDHDFVDWEGHWGKIQTLKLECGFSVSTEALPSEIERFRSTVQLAKGIEKHIRTQRAGKGRFITVHTNELPKWM